MIDCLDRVLMNVRPSRGVCEQLYQLERPKKSLCGMLELHSVQKIVAPYNPKFAYNHAAIRERKMYQLVQAIF